MKKTIITVTAALLSAALLFIGAPKTEADGADADPVITYSFLQAYGEQLKAEILDGLGNCGENSLYRDITVSKGQIIHLSPECELIYRGGGAVAVTSSAASGEGITDISAGKELFSGNPLEFCHIYHSSESESKKAVLITGSSAFFTVRGSYEID